MIAHIWFGYSSWYMILLPLSWLYGFVTAIIRFSYRYGLRKVYRFPLPIVVIGNLVTGGNGKTPVVLWLVEQLKQRGWQVGVVSRGYGGQSKRYPLILNATISSAECGDEPLLIWQRTGVPVAVAPRRTDAVAALLQTYTLLDIIITDDGLQHYALARDIEWVVIDGERRFGNGWWLPAGPMRERASRLDKVQVIIVNGGEAKPGEVQIQLQPSKAINLLSGKQCALNCMQQVIAIAGIGCPSRFFTTLRANGILPLKEVSFADHQVYYEQVLAALTPGNEILLMTEKDAVKCHAFARNNWWYLPVDVVLPKIAAKELLVPVENSIKHYLKLRNKKIE